MILNFKNAFCEKDLKTLFRFGGNNWEIDVVVPCDHKLTHMSCGGREIIIAMCPCSTASEDGTQEMLAIACNLKGMSLEIDQLGTHLVAFKEPFDPSFLVHETLKQAREYFKRQKAFLKGGK